MSHEKLSGKDRFDHEFFRMSLLQAKYTDPQVRFLLELTYEALVEAGVNNFKALPLADVGVYVGSSFSDFHTATVSSNRQLLSGYEHIGAAGAMLANSISRFFGFGGVSLKIDSACSSSSQAMDAACHDIRVGKSKIAIVAGCNLVLDPNISQVYKKMNLVCTEKNAEKALCKPFCDSTDGYLRQEAVVVFVLSPKKELQAHGCLCIGEILGHKTKTGSGASITTPCPRVQKKLTDDVALMAWNRLDEPATVRYVECHGSGTKLGDETESAALTESIKSGKNNIYSDSVLIGSVKGNIGHTESASGLVSLAKVILCLERGIIPPNLHFSKDCQNRKCKGFSDDTLHVVTQKESIERDAILVVNSFGFGGTCVQIIVKGIPLTHEVSFKTYNQMEPWMNINPIFGRTTFSTYKVSKEIIAEKICIAVGPPNVNRDDLSEKECFNARSFTSPIKRITYTKRGQSTSPRSIWLVFAGIGAVWPGMGYELYEESEIFKHTFTQCKDYLVKIWKCDSLCNLLMSWHSSKGSSKASQEGPFRNIVDAIVCLVSTQICLINLLDKMGLNRNICKGYIGHSAGEIVAGYFDGCYSLETTLDVAVLRGRAAKDASARTPGAMVVVKGLCREEILCLIKEMINCVSIACHTGHNQITLSGEEKVLATIEKKLHIEHPSVRLHKIDTFGVAFHSDLISPCVMRELEKNLSGILTKDKIKPRSQKWISTCCESSEDLGTYADAKYHCKGFRTCVEFVRACENIPDDSIIIECGPAAQFYSVFSDDNSNGPKRYFTLLRRNENAIETFANVYGQLYLEGTPFSSDLLKRRWTPREAFPLLTQRPIRESFLAWDHSEEFSDFLSNNKEQNPILSVHADKLSETEANTYHVGVCSHKDMKEKVVFPFDLDIDRWLLQHQVGGRSLLPVALYIFLLWKSVGLRLEKVCILKDFHIYKPIDLSVHSNFELIVTFRNNEHVSRGFIAWIHFRSSTSNVHVASCLLELQNCNKIEENDADLDYDFDEINTKLLYHQLGRHGYSYGRDFQVMTAISKDMINAKILQDFHCNLKNGRAQAITQLDSLGRLEDSNERKAYIKALDGILQHIIAYKLRGSQYGECRLPIRIDYICLGTKEVTIAGLKLEPLINKEMHVIKKMKYIPCPVQSKIDENPESDIYHLSGNDDFDTWKQHILCLKKLDKNAISDHFSLLISSTPGFVAFVRSLQKEPGFENVRGLQNLTFSDIPEKVVRQAQHIFSQNKNLYCLVAVNRRSHDNSGDSIALQREIEQPFDVEKQKYPSPNGCFLTLISTKPDKLSCWEPLSKPLDCSTKKATVYNVAVRYASLNFRDVMIGTGKLSRNDIQNGYSRGSNGLGIDFAGYKLTKHDSHINSGEIGKKIIGLGCNCITETLQNQPSYLCWELEDNDDLEAYATVPCIYATAYYALYMRGQLQSCSRVLVHCGTGGVGQAALHLCRQRLANPALQLFVTCSNPEKKLFLQEKYQIPARNIGDSRSDSFVNMISKQTNNKGVDLVLNSLNGELVEASIKCLSFNGHFLELGKGKLNPGAMDELRRNDRQFSMIDLDQLMACRQSFEPLRKMIELGLHSKEIVPINHKVFEAPHETRSAFDYLCTGRHIGKALLKIEPGKISATIPNISAILTDKQQVIVIVGGIGGLGLCLAEFFAKNLRSGCKLILFSKSVMSNDEQFLTIQRLRHIYKASVEIQSGDLSQYNEVIRLFKSLQNENLWGIVNAAGRAQDKVFHKMVKEDWLAPFGAKVDITQNISNALDDPRFSDMCINLQHFVCISSIVAAKGNIGQTNYACANSAMEQIILDRVIRGKKGLCVRLGLLPHVGIASKIDKHKIETTSLQALSVERALLELERLMVCGSQGIFGVYGHDQLKLDNYKINEQINSAHDETSQMLAIAQKHVYEDLPKVATLSTKIKDLQLDSLALVLLLNELREKVDLRNIEDKEILQHSIQELSLLLSKSKSVFKINDSIHIVVVATLGKHSICMDTKKLKDSTLKSLASIRRQTLLPDTIFIIFEKEYYFCEDFIEQVQSILPDALIRKNERTGAIDESSVSLTGALNTGIMKSCDELPYDDNCWIAPFFTETSQWAPNYLESCIAAANVLGQNCRIVVSSYSDEDMKVIDPFMEKAFLAHRSLMMEAGLFDEAMSSMADIDLYLRLQDVMSGNTKHIGICTIKALQPKISKAIEDDHDLRLILYKYPFRFMSKQIDTIKKTVKFKHDEQKWNPAYFLECQLVPMVMWNGDEKFVRRETFEAFSNLSSNSLCTLSSVSKPLKKMLVGIITCNKDRIRGVLSDLSSMLDDQRHCVVVFANNSDRCVGDSVKDMMKGQHFRSNVIYSTDRIVSKVCSENKNTFPLPIAEARTIVQTFLFKTAQVEEFDAISIMDDDIRLPRTWGIRDEDESAGDILLGRALKTPPNPTVMSMRTQLIDFVFALDLLHIDHQHHMLSVLLKEPANKVFKNLEDQYYDSSSKRWDHLEVPKFFEFTGDAEKFVEECWHKIFVGEPLAREAVSLENGHSLQRGGCMILFRDNLSLLQTPQIALPVHLASKKETASRRSDSFWVQMHYRSNSKKPIVRKSLAFYHENIHDEIPSPQKMREIVALEMIGAILCRPHSERERFSRCRINAQRCSNARIKGICTILKSRPYFCKVKKLSAFVSALEELFEESLWQSEVYTVVEKHLQLYALWTAHLPSPQLTAKTIELDQSYFNFLHPEILKKPKFPSASELKAGISMPIPCIHRVYKDDEILHGAHKIQAEIGMSLKLSEIENRLQQLAQLCKITKSRALVTMDDGFRDVILLKRIFKELSESLQPVLFVPSAILREGEDKVQQRHLPLTCLYHHCAISSIDPHDKDILGNANRYGLKTLPECLQYKTLIENNIPIDVNTNDLLTMKDLHALVGDGWWIGTHGPDHSYLSEASSFGDTVSALEDDFTILKNRGWVPWFAWPEGNWCSRLADQVALLSNGPTAQFGLSTLPPGEGQHQSVVSRVIWSGKVDRRKKVLVTGGSGFLGKYLCLLLQSYNFDVFNFDIATGGDILNQKALITEFRLNKIEVCIHLAAVSDLYHAEGNPKEAHRINVDGTKNVLSCCDECGVRLLFASTCCAYGNNGVDEKNDELSPCVPTEIYAETKLIGEKIIMKSSRFGELHHVVMRLATFYGPGMRGALATARFLKAACHGEPIYIHGSGNQTRCYTHVHDIANGIRVILETENFSGVVNVADDQECSVNELAKIAMKIVDAQVEVQHINDRKGQIKRSKISNERLRNLGNKEWKPTVSLEEGLKGCLNKENFLHKEPIMSALKSRATPDKSKILRKHTKLPLRDDCNGEVHVSDILEDGTQIVAYIVGNLRSREIALRIHSECLFGDVFGSLKCDCGPQLRDFKETIGDNRPGILTYIKQHEGRGFGLLIKTHAYYDLDQNPGKSHNQALLDAGARGTDARHFDKAADFILNLIKTNAGSEKTSCANTITDTLNFKTTIVFHTNNNEKLKALNQAIVRSNEPFIFCQQRQIPAESHCSPFNIKYLKEKEIENGQSGLQVTAKLEDVNEVKFPLCQNIDILPGIETRINRHVFDVTDPALFDFVMERGYVVVRGHISLEDIQKGQKFFEHTMNNQYQYVKQRLGDSHLSMKEFTSCVSQLRDLFLSNETENIFKEWTNDTQLSSLSNIARRVMDKVDPHGDWNGVKLLHDHIITKPPEHSSKHIPLHQDRMFWPVDIPGCSTWTLLSDAPLDGGCMEVIDMNNKPHKNHQSTAPVDFMADEHQSGLSNILKDDTNAVRWLIPMKAGETLIFTSHTWHRSSPNEKKNLNRIAYIQTWVHPKAKWRPDLVPWHPVNEYLRTSIKPGETLSGEHHPCIIRHPDGHKKKEFLRGNFVCQESGSNVTATKNVDSDISMFDASDVISNQLYNIFSMHVGSANLYKAVSKLSLLDILKDQSNRTQLVNATMNILFQSGEPESTIKIERLKKESSCETFPYLLDWALKQILISGAAYECHRSRNVFNSAYSAWWLLAGKSWNEYFLNSTFQPEYRLCKSDVTCFLSKISVERDKYEGSGRGQLQLLEDIICGCLEHVPFQNLTMLTRVNDTGNRNPPTLGEIINDMVLGFGGLCTTRNPFLFLLLSTLGFDKVTFVSGTMCSLHGEELENAHVALLVHVENNDYWVDISNGFPYIRPLALNTNGTSVIRHPFVDTRIVLKSRNNCEFYVIQHNFHHKDGENWVDNYYFFPLPITYHIGFATMHKRHYDCNDNFGPFLKNFRFNLWSRGGGVLVRNNKAHFYYSSNESVLSKKEINLWDTSGALPQMIRENGFKVNDDLISLGPKAWALSQVNNGAIKQSENVIVTGGFFDNSSDAYIGIVSVWRSIITGVVIGLTFQKARHYSPKAIPVINKGFSGGTWFQNKLYVCWPNRVAVISPSSDWNIIQHIDNPQFNDLHHVHACEEGIFVANTGLETIDHLSYSGKLLSRVGLVENTNLNDCGWDIRDQKSHNRLRGKDKEHVNYVFTNRVKEEHYGSMKQKRYSVKATLLQSKRIVQLRPNKRNWDTIKNIVTLPQKSPPHEGFLQDAKKITKESLIWNSTVDGLVIASDANSGKAVKIWNLNNYSMLPRGWTRGLCLLEDGFLIGSTIIRGTAESWIEKHDNQWSFDVARSRTAVCFIPFDESTEQAPKSVEFLNKEKAKIFSLLQMKDL